LTLSGSTFVQLLISGVAIGLVYGLIGLGFLTIYRTSGVVNFAQGEFLMLGALVSYQLWSVFHIPYLVAGLIALVVTALVGVIMYYGIVRPLRNAPILAVMIGTLGFSFLVQAVTTIGWTSYPFYGPPFYGDKPIMIGGVAIMLQNIWVIILTFVMLGLLYYLNNHTKVGKAMTATATDPLAARIVGIHTGRLVLVAIVISAVIGAATGVSVSSLLSMSTTVGTVVMIKGFVCAVLGGWGSASGSIAGGVVLGLAETLAGGFLPSGYKDAIALVLLLLVLYFRPGGILKAKLVENVGGRS
jgi:branched-chain amino acid transport system permease protein